MKKAIYSIITVGILVYMIMNPIQALTASKNGVLLWAETIIPTLLPFMILSNLIIRLNIVPKITFFIAPFFKRTLGLTPNGCYAVIIGFLCGYPMGAKVTADLSAGGMISKEEGQYLLGFCNNVSPMFIITYLVNGSLKDSRLLFPTLLIIYISPVLCAIITNYTYRKSSGITSHIATKKTPKAQINFELVDVCISNAFESITKLGGYIIMFSIVSSIVLSLPVANRYITYGIVGFTEITTGIRFIADAPLSLFWKYLLLMAATSFGGLSSIAQTESMIRTASLSLPRYISSKILNMGITLLLTLVFLR